MAAVGVYLRATIRLPACRTTHGLGRQVGIEALSGQYFPRFFRLVGKMEELFIARRYRPFCKQSAKIDDGCPVLGKGGAFLVCSKVRISKSSSNVPKPPGKTAKALARMARCILRIAK